MTNHGVLKLDEPAPDYDITVPERFQESSTDDFIPDFSRPENSVQRNIVNSEFKSSTFDLRTKRQDSINAHLTETKHTMVQSSPSRFNREDSGHISAGESLPPPTPNSMPDDNSGTLNNQLGSNNGNTVLQLVLPQNVLRGLSQEPNDSFINTPITISPSNKFFTYSPSIVDSTTGTRYRNGGHHNPKINRLSHGFNSAASMHSEAASSYTHHPPPSSDGEKSQMFRSFISAIMSCIYGIFLVTFGSVVYAADLLSSESTIAVIFNLYLVSVGMVYLVYLFFDIRLYVSKAQKHLKATTDDNDEDLPPENVEVTNVPAPNHGFCFAVGRHAANFYLKVGAGVFCFGHLIHSGLILSSQITYLSSEEYFECFSIPILAFDIIYPVYSFFQLFFLFKYANVIINHCKEAAKLLIAHTIASSLCFWIWAIIRESTDSLAKYDTSSDEEDGGGNGTLNNYCRSYVSSTIFIQFSPYLYPFTIEYSILIVGILYIIWSNIGNCKRGGGSSAEGVACPPLAGPEAGSNMILHADCNHANRGLFGGILVLVAVIVAIIFSFATISSDEFAALGTTVNQITELIVLSGMTLTAILAYRQMATLDVNYHAISMLDDILLFIAIPAFFLYAIFSIMPAAEKNDWLKISILTLGVVQVLIQTPMIIDGLRRCSNSRKLRNVKPARELITFLIICNLALWIMETFAIKSSYNKDDRYEYYGNVLWTILKHMTLPLTMFYRFHSSVCLVDIWQCAYNPGEVDH